MIWQRSQRSMLSPFPLCGWAAEPDVIARLPRLLSLAGFMLEYYSTFRAMFKAS
jgi:hypothetical protein